jgi:hypothetical protein
MEAALETVAPARRHRRDVVSSVRVNLTRDEARMLARLQASYDVPYATLLRLILREEYQRSFAPTPRAFADFTSSKEGE